MFKSVWTVLLAFVFGAIPVYAQQNEISFLAGGGVLIGKDRSKPASAYTVAYTRHLNDQWAVEGAIEIFFVNVPGFGRDDYAGVQAAAIYHIRSDQRLVPYLTAGIGKTTTDFTELPAGVVGRFGGGVKYYFDQQRRYGVRFELRHEIIGERAGIFYPSSNVNFPSARIGITCRF